MARRQIKRLPIVDSRDKQTLVGLVTRNDVLKAHLLHRIETVQNKKEDEIFHSQYIQQLLKMDGKIE